MSNFYNWISNSIELSSKDTHNGQQKVSYKDGYYYKPRCIYWEWLLLSSTSILREYLQRNVFSELQQNPLDLIPQTDTVMCLSPFYNGKVKKIHTPNVNSGKLTPSQCYQIGGVIAFLAWLGIEDLCGDNIFFGFTDRSELIFVPIDIEVIWSDHQLPSQTHLLSSPNLKLHESGLRNLDLMLKKKNKTDSIVCIAEITKGYIETLSLLLSKEGEIKKNVISTIIDDNPPIRVIIKTDKQYERYYKKRTLKKDYYKSEIKQLKNGDTPYYFTYFDCDEVLYIDNETKLAIASEVTKQCIQVNNCLIDNNPVQYKRVNGRDLISYGAVELVNKLFNNKNSEFECKTGALYLKVSGQTVILKYENMMNLRIY